MPLIAPLFAFGDSVSIPLRDNRSAAKGHAFIPSKRRLLHSPALGMSGIGAILPLPPRARKGLETAQSGNIRALIGLSP